jgi:hypothetical protein
MKMHIEYTDKTVTPWGGMIQMKRLMDETGLREFLVSLNLPEGKSNNSIDALAIVESFLVSVWIGCFKFSHTAVVRLDESLKKIFGWKRVASGTTFGRFFGKFNQGENQRVFVALGQWFFSKLKYDNFTLDVDSSVVTRYGNQQGAHVGFNPKKSGRPSHHPLFAFVSDIKMVANCWLRSGDTSSSNNTIGFLEETFSILKDKRVGLFRADSGFCSDSIFKYLEGKSLAYVVAARLHQLLQHKISQIKCWNYLDSNLSIAEFEYKAKQWQKPRRIVVIRQSMAVNPKATGKKLKLFSDDPYYQNFRYHAFVTNQDLPAEQIWRQYKQRADAENRIKELKEDFGAEGFCMNNFFATEAAMRMVCMSYNLMSLYRQLTHQGQAQPTLSTLRFNCFAVGSWITKSGNKTILKMSVPLKRRQWYDGLMKNVKPAVWPWSLQN